MIHSAAGGLSTVMSCRSPATRTASAFQLWVPACAGCGVEVVGVARGAEVPQVQHGGAQQQQHQRRPLPAGPSGSVGRRSGHRPGHRRSHGPSLRGGAVPPVWDHCAAAVSRTVNTVRPDRLSRATSPPCAATTAATMASPSPVLPDAARPRAVAAGEPLEHFRLQRGGDARAVVGDGEHHLARVALARCPWSTVVPGGVWVRALASRLSQHLVQPRGRRRARSRARRAGRAASGGPGSATCASLTASTTSRDRSTGSDASGRPASSRASSSRSSTSDGHPDRLGLDPAHRVRDVRRHLARVPRRASSA